MKSDTTDKKLQKSLDAVISNEWAMANLYASLMLGCAAEDESVIHDIFSQASYAKTMHLQNIVGWCKFNMYSVPCKINEFKKNANDDIANALDKFKVDENARYYFELATTCENKLMEAYQKAIESAPVAGYPDLQSILWQNYYDAQQTIEKLNSAEIGYSAALQFGY